MSKAGKTGEEVISKLITTVPFQGLSISQRADFINRTFDIKISAADLMERGDDKDRIIELILKKGGR